MTFNMLFDAERTKKKLFVLSYVNLMGILYMSRVHVVGHGWLSKTCTHDDA